MYKKIFTLVFTILILTLRLFSQSHEIGVEAGYGISDYNSYFRMVNPFKDHRFDKIELALFYDYSTKKVNQVKLETGIGYSHTNYISDDSRESYIDILKLPVGFEFYADKKMIFFFGGGLDLELTLNKSLYGRSFYNNVLLGGHLCTGLNLKIKRSRCKLKLKSDFDFTPAFYTSFEGLYYHQNSTTVSLAYIFNLVRSN